MWIGEEWFKGKMTTDPKKLVRAAVIFLIALGISQLSVFTSNIWIESLLGVLFVLGAGMSLCICFDVSQSKSIVLIASSIGIFGLVILYAQYSNGLLFS